MFRKRRVDWSVYRRHATTFACSPLTGAGHKTHAPYAIRASSAWLTMVDVMRWEAFPSP